MKKQYIGIGMVIFLLLVVCLSGCGEEKTMLLPDGTKVIGDFQKAEILNYSVVTEGYKDGEIINLGYGFIHNNTSFRYKINIAMKNIDSTNYVTLEALFYDTDNTLLCTLGDTLERTDEAPLYKNQIFHFNIIYSNNDSKYKEFFSDVDHLNFYIYADRSL